MTGNFFYTHCIFINDIHDSFIMSCLIFFFLKKHCTDLYKVHILQRAFIIIITAKILFDSNKILVFVRLESFVLNTNHQDTP